MAAKIHGQQQSAVTSHCHIIPAHSNRDILLTLSVFRQQGFPTSCSAQIDQKQFAARAKYPDAEENRERREVSPPSVSQALRESANALLTVLVSNQLPDKKDILSSDAGGESPI